MEIIEKDLPQLIVALDSLNDDANYVHILDAKENTNYYCPCCKGTVKPRVYKKDKNYQVQAHYYHETGECNEETFVHYICKTWLFEKGCKFIVNDIQYEVENIEVEKTLHTLFGDYRPDIIVTTTNGKIFYFEIKTTNKKTELYAPKWDELGNDVVEVDTRYFINQKYKNDIPVFNLIYSDGKCFIKTYSKNDYEDIIAKRKLEWKRQDKLNYKIQWERLDWFWLDLQKYINNKDSLENLKTSFRKLTYEDKTWVYLNIKNKSCVDIKNVFINIINEEFLEWINFLCGKYKNDVRFKITYKELKSSMYFHIIYYNEGYTTTAYYKDFIKYKGIYKKENVDDVDSIVEEKIHKLDKMVEYIHNLEKIPYVQKIIPYGGEQTKSRYHISDIKFNIHFQDYFYSKYIKNYIGTETWIDYNSLVPNTIENFYKYNLEKFKENFYKNEFYKMVLEKDSDFMLVINTLHKTCNSLRGFDFKVGNNYKTIRLFYHSQTLFYWEFQDSHIFGEFEKELLQRINEKITQQIEFSKMTRNKKVKITKIVNSYIKQIEKHPTTKWTFRVDYKKRWIIGLLGYEMYFESNYCIFPDDNLESYIEDKILEAMTILKDKLKSGLPFYNGLNCTLYPEVRLMEER